MDSTQFAAMMDLLRQTLTAAVQGAARPAAPDPLLQRPTKMTAEDRPEAYLEVFEAMATSAGWEPARWASYLLPQLTGEAQAAARTLSQEQMLDYPLLKATILNRVGATPEGYRKKFREEQFTAGEHPRTIAHRLKDYAMGWLNPAATTKASYLFDPSVWRTCTEPANIVLWNWTLFTTLLALSGIEFILCLVQLINGMLVVLCGNYNCCKQSVEPA